MVLHNWQKNDRNMPVTGINEIGVQCLPALTERMNMVAFKGGEQPAPARHRCSRRTVYYISKNHNIISQTATNLQLRAAMLATHQIQFIL